MPIKTSADGTKKEINRIIHNTGGAKKETERIYHGVNGGKQLVYESRDYTNTIWGVTDTYGVNGIRIGNSFAQLPEFVFGSGQSSFTPFVWLDMKTISSKKGDRIAYSYYYNCKSSTVWSIFFMDGGNTQHDIKTINAGAGSTAGGTGSFIIQNVPSSSILKLEISGSKNISAQNTIKVYDIYLNGHKIG